MFNSAFGTTKPTTLTLKILPTIRPKTVGWFVLPLTDPIVVMRFDR